jgi:tetratricopeptide (TPR) repeat protein
MSGALVGVLSSLIMATSPLVEEVNYVPRLIGGAPRLRSPCWFDGEVWALSGWKGLEDRELLARHDGQGWRFYRQPEAFPKALVCDGTTRMVVGESSVHRWDGAWRQKAHPRPNPLKVPWSPSFRFAGGSAIVAHTPREAWRWANDEWQPVPLPKAAAGVILSIVPEAPELWFIELARHLGSTADALLAQPGGGRRKAQQVLQRVGQGWALARRGELAAARKIAEEGLRELPHDGQVLFFDARLAWLEQDSPRAGMERVESHLRHANGRFGRARLMNLYGAALDALGDAAQALTWFERAALEYPDAPSLANIAEMHEKLGDEDRAKKWARRAVATGDSQEVTARILERAGVPRPPTLPLQGELWEVSVLAFNPLTGTLERRDVRTLTAAADETGAQEGRLEGARLIEADGTAVWPDDIDPGRPELRAGPIWAPDFEQAALRSASATSGLSGRPPGTILVQAPSLEVRRGGVTQTLTYVPHVRYLLPGGSWGTPDLRAAHSDGERLYWPFFDASTGRSRIQRFTLHPGASEALGAVPGQLAATQVRGQPAWLAGPVHEGPPTLDAIDRPGQLYSLDGATALTELAASPENPARLLPGDGQAVSVRAEGPWRFDGERWVPLPYGALGIPLEGEYLRAFAKPRGHADPPDRYVPAYYPVAVVGSRLWLASRRYWSPREAAPGSWQTFYLIDLERPGPGATELRVEVQARGSLSGLAWRWANVVDGRLFAASESGAAVVEHPRLAFGDRLLTRDWLAVRASGSLLELRSPKHPKTPLSRVQRPLEALPRSSLPVDPLAPLAERRRLLATARKVELTSLHDPPRLLATLSEPGEVASFVEALPWQPSEALYGLPRWRMRFTWADGATLDAWIRSGGWAAPGVGSFEDTGDKLYRQLEALERRR